LTYLLSLTRHSVSVSQILSKSDFLNGGHGVASLLQVSGLVTALV